MIITKVYMFNSLIKSQEKHLHVHLPTKDIQFLILNRSCNKWNNTDLHFKGHAPAFYGTLA